MGLGFKMRWCILIAVTGAAGHAIVGWLVAIVRTAAGIALLAIHIVLLTVAVGFDLVRFLDAFVGRLVVDFGAVRAVAAVVAVALFVVGFCLVVRLALLLLLFRGLV